MNASRVRGPLDAIILAGGRSERLGGASKPDLLVGGRTLLATAIGAARTAHPTRVVVVGPPSLEAPDCVVVREDPPFGGPVAALAAGLAVLRADAASAPHGERASPRGDATPGQGEVLVLGCDMPDAPDAVARLLSARPPRADGLCLRDAAGRTQWLAAVYSLAALARAVDALGDLDGASMRRLAATLDLDVVDDGGSTHDIDTWSDLAMARSARQEAAP